MQNISLRNTVIVAILGVKIKSKLFKNVSVMQMYQWFYFRCMLSSGTSAQMATYHLLGSTFVLALSFTHIIFIVFLHKTHFKIWTSRRAQCSFKVQQNGWQLLQSLLNLTSSDWVQHIFTRSVHSLVGWIVWSFVGSEENINTILQLERIILFH